MLDLEASKTALNLTALLTALEISQLNEAIKEKLPAIAGQRITILQLKYLNNSPLYKATKYLHYSHKYAQYPFTG